MHQRCMLPAPEPQHRLLSADATAVTAIAAVLTSAYAEVTSIFCAFQSIVQDIESLWSASMSEAPSCSVTAELESKHAATCGVYTLGRHSQGLMWGSARVGQCLQTCDTSRQTDAVWTWCRRQKYPAMPSQADGPHLWRGGGPAGA